MAKLQVEDEVVHHQEAGKSIHIHLVFVPHLLIEIVAESVEVVLDDLQSFCGIGLERFLREVGVFDVDGQVVDVGIEFVRLVIVLVELKQHAAVLLVDIYAVVGDADFFGEVVAAAIVAIQVEVNRDDVVGAGCPCQAGGLHADGIGHHGIALVVREQHPALSLLQSEGRHFFVEFQAIGLFRVAPAAVATSLNPYAVLHILIDAVAIEAELRMTIGASAGDVPVPVHIYFNAGNFRNALGQEIDADDVVQSVVTHCAGAVYLLSGQAAPRERGGIDDVFGKAMSAYLRLLDLIIHIHDSPLRIGFERGREVFGDGWDVEDNVLRKRVANLKGNLYVPRHLIVKLVVEFERR